MEQFFLALVGFSGGFIVAGGVVALMVGLGIITRFIGISRTAKHIRGAVGTIATVLSFQFPVGAWVLAVAGLFMGIFVGGWIMALAEVVNVFPVYCRRLGITKGTSWIVITLAAGKTLGSLLHFYMRWGKG